MKKTGIPCVRCGKERVVAKTWKERVGNSVLVHTQTVCQDKACQKIVDDTNAAATEKREALALRRVESKQARMNSRLLAVK